MVKITNMQNHIMNTIVSNFRSFFKNQKNCVFIIVIMHCDKNDDQSERRIRLRRAVMSSDSFDIVGSYVHRNELLYGQVRIFGYIGLKFIHFIDFGIYVAILKWQIQLKKMYFHMKKLC